MHNSFVEYAHELWYEALIRMQNSDMWPDQPLYINGLFQQLYAESIVRDLRSKPYFQKFGGKTLEIIMTPTDEPHMYNIGLQIQ